MAVGVVGSERVEGAAVWRACLAVERACSPCLCSPRGHGRPNARVPSSIYT